MAVPAKPAVEEPAGPPPKAFATTIIPFAKLFGNEMVFCSACGNQCEVKNCRVRSKRDGTWQCTACDVSLTQLNRELGAGFGKVLSKFPVEKAVEFFNKCRGNSSKTTKAMFQEYQEKYVQKEDYYETGGSFLLLSVWARKGYDAEAIKSKSKPSDVMPGRMFDHVYRVPALYVATRVGETSREGGSANASSKGNMSSLVKELMQRIPKSGGEPPAAAAASSSAEGREQVDDESDDGDSSSETTSSSSSSRKRKNKKSKKDKKKRKEQKKKDKKKKKERKRKEEEKKAAAEKKEAAKKAAAEQKEAEKKAAAEQKESEKKLKKQQKEAETLLNTLLKAYRR